MAVCDYTNINTNVQERNGHDCTTVEVSQKRLAQIIVINRNIIVTTQG